MLAVSEEMSPAALRRALGLTDRRHFREAYLAPLLREGLIEMTIPGKPHSNRQRYRLTRAGRNRVEQLEAEVRRPNGGTGE